MHEHYDTEGNLTGTTVVTRESMWDEASRGRALRLAEYERSIDKVTGLPFEAAHTNQPFIVHSDVVNYAQRAIDKQKSLDEEHPERGKADEKWFESRTYYVRTVDPDDLPTPD